MKSAVRARTKTVAFCVMLLAVLCLVWYAGTLAPDNAVISGNYTAVGNSYARFSSENAELLSGDGEVLSAVEFGYPERYLTSSGETAVAWEPGGNIAFLGAGGARLEKAEGQLLGVFGSDTGAVSALIEDGGEVKAEIFAAPGVKLVLSPGNRPIAAVIGGRGTVLALLSPERDGFYVSAYSLPDMSPAWRTPLDGPQYDLEWTDTAVLCAFGGDGEIYIDGLTGEMLPRSPD